MKDQSRRQFLRKTLAAGLPMLLLDPLKPFFSKTKPAFQPPAWAELVDFARWSPSVHNLQAHQLRIISPTEAELCYDPARLLPIGDPKAIFVTVAMGVFVENLSIAAAPHGSRVEIAEIFDPITVRATKTTRFARLRLVPTGEKEPIARELILKRRTSRKHYDGHELSPGTLDLLKKEAESFGHEFFSSSEKPFLDTVVDLNQRTLFEDLGSKADRDELNTLFRYSQKEARAKRDGLWAKCMGFSGVLMKSVFTHHQRWEKGLRKKLLGKHYRASFEGTAKLCWLGGDFKNTADWVKAGQLMARAWLLLTQNGAYMQPFGSLITNPGAYQKLNETFAQPGPGKVVWMVFRAGYSREPTKSFRLETDQIIIR